MLYIVDCFEGSGSLVEFVVSALSADEAHQIAISRYNELQRQEQELIAVECVGTTPGRAKALVQQGRAINININV